MPTQEIAEIGVDKAKQVLQNLRDWPNFKMPSVNVRSPTLKWRLTSAMQKAFRRNTPQFLIYLAGLAQIDPNYAWRRFAVVVMEDAGPMIPKYRGVMVALMWLSKGKKYRDEAGATTEDLIRFGRFWAEKSRCRIVSDAVSVLRRSDAGRAILPILETGDSNGTTAATYQNQFDQKGAEIYPQLLTYAGYSKNPATATKQVLNMIGTYDPVDAWIAVEGASQRHGGMFSLYPHLMTEVEKGQSEEDELFPAWEMIGAYPTYAFDMHVSEGKSALRYFMAMSSVPYIKYVSDMFHGDKEKMALATKEPLFFVEIGRLAKRLTSNGKKNKAREYEWKSVIACAKERGVPEGADLMAMCDLLWDAIPDLNYARRKTCNP